MWTSGILCEEKPIRSIGLPYPGFFELMVRFSNPPPAHISKDRVTLKTRPENALISVSSRCIRLSEFSAHLVVGSAAFALSIPNHKTKNRCRFAICASLLQFWLISRTEPTAALQGKCKHSTRIQSTRLLQISLSNDLFPPRCRFLFLSASDP